jgi:hypothetical protein
VYVTVPGTGATDEACTVIDQSQVLITERLKEPVSKYESVPLPLMPDTCGPASLMESPEGWLMVTPKAPGDPCAAQV